MTMLHRKRGSATVFSTVLALVITVLGIGFLFLLLYMGAQRETKNAVDAGTLNLGKQALDQISVNIIPTDKQQCFMDVATDTDHGSIINDNKITLRRINRVWAKAMLIGINADAAASDGNAGSGGANANSAFQGAEEISNALAAKLVDENNLHGFFTDLAKQNSVRMIGTNASVSVVPGAGWQTSLMERERESNIVLTGNPPGFNLPPGYSLNGSYSTECTRTPKPSKANGLYFLKGYLPMQIAGHTFWQVPFLYDEKPHSVAKSLFDESHTSAKALSWNNPVPNAFSAHGMASKPGAVAEQAKSWMLTNPRQPFKLAMPHSFMHIKLDDNKSHWYFYPFGPVPAVEFGTPQTYGYTTDSQTGTPMPGGGVLCALVSPGSVTLGLDVVGRTLDQIIFGVPAGNTAKVEGYMVNRINEMITKVGEVKTAADLHSCLNDPLTIGYMVAGERDFYVFSPDGESLTVQPKALALVKAPWLATMIDKSADGTETKIIDDATSPAPMFFMPSVTPDPFCVFLMAAGWGTWHKDVYWKPGTGYNGCLGEIRSKRWTNVNSLGVCTPII